MAKVLGIHEIELLPGVSEADFERLVLDEFRPGVSGFQGWTVHLGKADRGERDGKYAIIIEIESQAARDRYSPSTNEMSEEGQRALERLSELSAKWATFSPTAPGQNTVFTDYILIGE
jgi:hypothetical protein